MKTKSQRFTMALIAAILAATILSPNASAQEQVKVPWAELPYVLEGRVVSTVLVDGTTLRGRVRDVSSTELRFDVKKTSNRDLYPKGESHVPREQLRVFSYTEKKGNWRAIGAAIGAAGGVAAGTIPVQIAYNEHGSARAAGYAFFGALGAGLGYLGGHIADTHTTTVVVANDQVETSELWFAVEPEGRGKQKY